MSENEDPGPPRTRAAVRRSRWPGWIWSIPIAALLVVGWLGIRALTSHGEDITISFDDSHGLDAKGGKVVYRGISVGQVTKVALTKDGSGVTVGVTIDQSAEQFVRSGTRFWLRNANPSLTDLSSLGAVLSGPTIVMQPGPGEKATHFKGIPYEPVGPVGDSQPQRYGLSFGGAVGEIKTGDPVKLRGFTVGEVKTIGFHVDAGTGTISTPVALDLYPSLLHLQGVANPDGGAALRAAVDKLIEEGLRARLERDPPLVGGYRIVLDMEPGASAPAATVSGEMQIPTASGGGLDAIVTRLKNVPVDQIAQNVLDITHHADELVSSPDLKSAVVQLDASLKQVHATADAAHATADEIRKTTAEAGPKIDRLIESLRRTASELDRTAESARREMGGPTSQAGLQTTMQEVTEAARSVRDLANYLDRHPEAMIQGRSGE